MLDSVNISDSFVFIYRVCVAFSICFSNGSCLLRVVCDLRFVVVQIGSSSNRLLKSQSRNSRPVRQPLRPPSLLLIPIMLPQMPTELRGSRKQQSCSREEAHLETHSSWVLKIHGWIPKRRLHIWRRCFTKGLCGDLAQRYQVDTAQLLHPDVADLQHRAGRNFRGQITPYMVNDPHWIEGSRCWETSANQGADFCKPWDKRDHRDKTGVRGGESGGSCFGPCYPTKSQPTP